jgi:hypothetical protein
MPLKSAKLRGASAGRLGRKNVTWAVVTRNNNSPGTGQPRYDQSLDSESVPETTRPRLTQCPGIGSESRLPALNCHRGLPQTFSQLLCPKKVKHLCGLQVWSSDCSFHWHGFREDEGVDGSEPRRIGGTTQAGTQRVSQAGFSVRLDIFGWRLTKRTDRSLAEVAVMKTPTIRQWYQILRQHYQFTVFQVVRYALWLAH